jgi:2'-5' RNA ligase
MKATFVLLANNELENMGRRIMLEAHKKAKLGFEMARLPHHVSLKQPFHIESLEDIEHYFDEFVKTLKPIKVRLKEVKCYPSSVFGYSSGVMVIEAEKSQELQSLHKELNEELENRFGECKADFDGDDYIFHMTVAIGGGSFDSYEKALKLLDRTKYDIEVVFNELGLLYYDEDKIIPGSYFCYKRIAFL